MASRHGKITLPTETHDITTHMRVKDAIGYLPPIEAGETHPSVPNHTAYNLSALNLKRIQSITEGQGRNDLPADLRVIPGKGFSNVYGRMAWHKVAPTITTKCTTYNSGRFGHPEQNRAISIREAACLQTFPIEFNFAGSMAAASRQVGNAMPPAIAALAGRQFLRQSHTRGN